MDRGNGLDPSIDSTVLWIRGKIDPLQENARIMSIYRRNIYLGSLHMAASFLPSIFVPLVGLVFPAVAMASLFLYIEQEEIG
uniref:Photosystem I reaction center subunit VIII n=1 Tax=Nephroselmis pyriformis TaxID=156128 RepID=A0A8A2H890_9CHLO|nr:subunit VIII of photosystem I [Nephroselmis pyriformis]QSV37274.1 subunit VIII of photosystem I [Nephroselmis pyriformis]